jgi:hypothetical protein
VEILTERTLTLLTSRCHGNARNHFHTRTHACLSVEIIWGIRSDFALFISHFKFPFLASVMSGNKLEEGVKSPMGKFLFPLPCPDLLWAYPAFYPQRNGTPFQGDKLAWHEPEHFSAIRFCQCESIEIKSNLSYLSKDNKCNIITTQHRPCFLFMKLLSCPENRCPLFTY